jgi:pimeloyl-ACP methyl ester carboxylesterase
MILPMSALQFQILPDGRQTAYRHTPGQGPTLVFLPGYMSDMGGSKACAVFDWAVSQGRACLLLDYSGCGASAGDFADGTLSRWRDEVLALIEAYCPDEVVLIGSSMGGWLMLLVALALPGPRLAGLIGIAAAPDFTDWGYDNAQQAALARGEVLLEDNPYGPEATPTHPGLWTDGQANRLLGSKIALTCPVRLLHGQNDADVPWEISLKLVHQLRSADVQLTVIKDGDHRLSRPEDIALLLRIIAALAAAA